MMEKKYRNLKTTIFTLLQHLRLFNVKTTKKITALRRTVTSPTEGKNTTEQKS